MKKKRYIYLTLILTASAVFVWFTLSGSSATFPKPIGEPADFTQAYSATDKDAEFLKAFENYLTQSFEATNTPGASIVIVKNGAVIYEKALGFKSAYDKDPVNTETLFRIASVSKGFTSILSGLISRDSLINWNDPMSNYVNYPIVNNAKNITIRNILSHTAGFPYQAYSTLVEDGQARDTMIRELLKIPLTRAPGEIHSYQNVAYSIMEQVLESATKKPFNDLMHERIFSPLGMKHASICYDSMISSTNLALPHGYRNKKCIPTTVTKSYYNVAAAGGINASISDMGKWLQALLGNNADVIPTEIMDQVFDPVIQIRVKNPFFSQYEKPRKGYYGMGWRIMEYPSDTLVYHGGYANGYKSGLAMNRNKKIGICVLSNAPSKFSDLALTNFFKMYNEHYQQDTLMAGY